MTTINDFVKELRLKKIFTSKQILVIENLYIYFNDLKIYKVAIAVNPLMLKKAKKLGLNGRYVIVDIDDTKITFGDDDDKLTKGSFVVLYDLNDSSYAIYDGEISEEDQIKSFKRSKRTTEKKMGLPNETKSKSFVRSSRAPVEQKLKNNRFFVIDDET